MKDVIAECFGSLTDFRKWDEKVFEVVCRTAAVTCRAVLEALDEELARTRDKSLRMLGKRNRTIVTKFGAVAFRRRLYRDSSGKNRFLLDDCLGLVPGRRSTPCLEAVVCELAAKMPYRQAADVLEATSGGVLSHQMIHTAVKNTADAFDAHEKAKTKRLVEYGELPESRDKKVPHLFVEADGTFINLQRETKKKAEVKLLTSHEGWRRVGKRKWRLKDKTVVAGLSSSQETWERFGASLLGTYHPEVLSHLVIGGDGASWIVKGTDVFGGSIYQLDRFHIKRSLLRSSGSWSFASKAYSMAVAGDIKGVSSLLESYAKDNPDRAEDLQKSAGYLKNNAGGLIDYRKRLEGDTSAMRGLGAIESNIDKVLANRMKKRGMAWSLVGAHRMAKILQMRAGGLLGSAIAPEVPSPSAPIRKALQTVQDNFTLDPGAWLEARVPALSGPHQSRRWVKTLREIAGTVPAGM